MFCRRQAALQLVDNPVKHGDRTLILRRRRPSDGGPKGTLTFYVYVYETV